MTLSDELISIFKTSLNNDVPLDAMTEGLEPGDTSKFLAFLDDQDQERAAYFLSFVGHLCRKCEERLILLAESDNLQVKYWAAAGLIKTNSSDIGFSVLEELGSFSIKNEDFQLASDIVDILIDDLPRKRSARLAKVLVDEVLKRLDPDDLKYPTFLRLAKSAGSWVTN